jgi:hypothetical protein
MGNRGPPYERLPGIAACATGTIRHGSEPAGNVPRAADFRRSRGEWVPFEYDGQKKLRAGAEYIRSRGR